MNSNYNSQISKSFIQWKGSGVKSSSNPNHTRSVFHSEGVTVNSVHNSQRARPLIQSKKADEDRNQIDKNFHLLLSIQHGHYENVQRILREGADVNKLNANKCTPLMEAIKTGHADCVQLLLDAGADVNHHDFEGYSPLIRATIEGNVQCVQAIINAGAYVNTTSRPGGYTSLMHGAKKGH